MSEEEIVSMLESENEEFKVLHEEHKILKAKMDKIKSKLHLTPEEELEKKNIQKQKLAKKDSMAKMIRDYKATNA